MLNSPRLVLGPRDTYSIEFELKNSSQSMLNPHDRFGEVLSGSLYLSISRNT